MALLPSSSSRATVDLLFSGSRRCPQRRFAKYGQGGFRADNGADCAAGAAILHQFNRMEALWGQVLHVEGQHLLRALCNAQLAPFAVQLVDFNPTAYRHARFSPFGIPCYFDDTRQDKAQKYTLTYLIIPLLTAFG
jgi:hypothetical protein